MNPLLVIGGLGILGFALMGLKKKPTSTYSTYMPYEPSPSDSDDPWRIASVPGFAIPGRVA